MQARIGVCFLWFALVFLSSAIGLSAAEEGRKIVVLTGAKLIDGAGHSPIENATLVIQ
jgi:hypothetical protein